ncbi:response regulator [bacterium SCSIO 12741]|nr:response regulator [bacterium SCSIO 12741]
MNLNNSTTTHILVVDDEYISNLIVTKYLDDCGEQVSYTVKNDGKQALDYLLECSPEGLPDYVFLDLRMPVMDGFEFLRNYAERFENNLKTRIYILTSSINQRDMDEARTFDCLSGYIQKPMNPLMLKDIIFQKA